MSINSTMDLRRHCVDGESEGLCNMSGSFMTVLENGIQQSFGETLAIIAEQTAKVKANPLAGLDGLVPTGGIFAGPLKKRGMQISVISFGGVCVLAVAVQCSDEDVVILQKTLDDMVQEITAYAEGGFLIYLVIFSA